MADLGRRGRRPGQRGGLRPPAWSPWRRRRISAAASRPRRGRPAIAAVLGRQRRDRGEGGGAAADLCRLRGRPKRRDRGTAPRRGSRASVAAGSPASRFETLEAGSPASRFETAARRSEGAVRSGPTWLAVVAETGPRAGLTKKADTLKQPRIHNSEKKKGSPRLWRMVTAAAIGLQRPCVLKVIFC